MMIIMTFPNHAINAPYAANTVITLIWQYLQVSLLLKSTQNDFSHNALLVITMEYTQHNANYVIKIYVGQTKNKFLIKWTNHCTFWKNNNTQNHIDKAALLLHFHNHHKNFISSHPDIAECYHIFLQEPRYYHNLDISKSKWIKKLKATININRTLLPKIFDAFFNATV